MSTAVAKKTSAEVAPLAPAVLTRIAELAADAPRADGDLGALLERIMDCETLEEASSIYDGLDNTADVANIAMMVRGFTLHESKYSDQPNALPFYLTVEAENYKTQEPIRFNTGAATVMITLLTAWKRGWFPFTAHIELKDLPNGYTAANLVFDA